MRKESAPEVEPVEDETVKRCPRCGTPVLSNTDLCGRCIREERDQESAWQSARKARQAGARPPVWQTVLFVCVVILFVIGFIMGTGR